MDYGLRITIISIKGYELYELGDIIVSSYGLEGISVKVNKD